jgi:hypothetical protein
VCTAIYYTFTGHGIVLKGMVWYYRSGDANGLTTEHTGGGVSRGRGRRETGEVPEINSKRWPKLCKKTRPNRKDFGEV